MDKRKRISNVVMLTASTREGLLKMQDLTKARIAELGKAPAKRKQLEGASRWLAYQLERNERERIRKRPGRVADKPFVPMAPKAAAAPPPPPKFEVEERAHQAQLDEIRSDAIEREMYQLERNERVRMRKRPGRVTKVIAADEEVVPPPAPVVLPPAVERVVTPPPPDPPPVAPEKEPLRMADREAEAASQTWVAITATLPITPDDVPVAEVAQEPPKKQAQPLRKTLLPMTTSEPLPPNTPPVNWPYFPRHGLEDAA